MKILIFLLIIPGFVVAGESIDKKEELMGFSRGFAHSLSVKDAASFNRLLDSREKFDEEDILNCFNDFSAFFSGNSYQIIILESDLTKYVDGNVAVILFVKKEFAALTMKSASSWDLVEKHWKNSVLATEVYFEKGLWKVKGTPFFLYRHVPWASDYG